MRGNTWEERTFSGLDTHIRRRLRALLLKQCKRKRTIARKLIRLGVRNKTAWRAIYQGRQSWWALSHAFTIDRALHNAYFAKRGLVSLVERWRASQPVIIAPEQLVLALG